MKSAKENILQKLRVALREKTPPPSLPTEEFKIFPDAPTNLISLFQMQFERLGGIFYKASNFESLLHTLKTLIEKEKWKELHCKDARLLHRFRQHSVFSTLNQHSSFSPSAVAITSCTQLIARTGSIVLNSRQAAGRKLGIGAETHIVFGHQNQLEYNIGAALERQKNKESISSMISVHSGASRTADIEKTLVMGAHGPRVLYLFLLTS